MLSTSSLVTQSELLMSSIRVTGPSDDDEDWLVGETLDGSRSGGFPKVCQIGPLAVDWCCS